ncbi:hypothetical protein [Luteimonas panaciterrae]|uniref:hypothetical protein n=1 Tax=Luteimonas panaciterrae TaxID=363885 RepID=UPI001CFB51CC|nr:hypothetical protein [Luteimonas panaciterrae]
MIRSLRLLSMFVVCAVLASGGAWAQDRRGGGDGRGGGRGEMSASGMQGMPDRGRMGPQVRPSRRDDTLSNSVRNAERTTPGGQILRAERMQYDGREVNRIKLMDERGRVRTYMDDPQQPRRLSPTRDDDD